MKITYLGTGAAEGVPAEFCRCAVCQKVRALGGREIRTRSQVLIDGTLCIDFPPESYIHSVYAGVDLSAIRTLLITHSHMDHFYAHDFILRGYKYAYQMTEPTLTVYGNGEVGKVFSECTRREMRPDVAAGIRFRQLSPFQSFSADGYTITPLPAVHTKSEQALLYLVERGNEGYLHLYDTGTVGEEVYRFLSEQGKRVQLVSLDCTLVDGDFSNSGRHMGLPENQAVIARLKEIGVADENTKFVITHFSHNSEPLQARLKAIGERYGVIPAYDGMEITV